MRYAPFRFSFPQKSWTPALEFFNRGHACILTAYVIHLIVTTLRSTFLVQALIFAPFFVLLCVFHMVCNRSYFQTSEVVTMSVCALALCQEKFRRLSGSQCLIRYFSFICPSQVMTCSMYVCDRRFISTASPPNPFELEQRIAPASTHTLPFD